MGHKVSNDYQQDLILELVIKTKALVSKDLIYKIKLLLANQTSNNLVIMVIKIQHKMLPFLSQVFNRISP